MSSETIKTIEEQYPECTDELMRNFDEAYNLWCKKQSDYGDGNIRLGLNLSSRKEALRNHNLLLAQLGLVIRMNDKIQRLLNLYKKQVFRSVPTVCLVGLVIFIVFLLTIIYWYLKVIKFLYETIKQINES
jgi:hypothetical protein